MKTSSNIRLAFLFIVLFTASLAVANTDPKTNTVTTATQKTIREYFKFPQVLLPMQNLHANNLHKVEVLFTTDPAGQVNFVLAKTDDQELKREIEKQFAALQLSHLKSNVAHSVTLNFRSM
jgi:hypothetical protein